LTPTKVSLPKEGQNRAEIEDCKGSNGSNDILHDCTEALRSPLAKSELPIDQCKSVTQSIPNAENLTSDASVTSVDSSEIIAANKNIEKRLTLRHSPAAVVVTNNDLEDIEDRGIENRSTSSSGGESA
jgi:hypothetical protein